MRVNIKQLKVSLSNRPVLCGIDLQIESGSSTAIVGLSGVGKTTLLRCIAGLTSPTSGAVLIDGKSPQEFYGGGLLSFLFQEACLWPHLTVQESLELTCKILGRVPNTSHIKHQLAMVGLANAASLYPYQLSVGMKARAAIARAFCIPPKVLLMDEPFAAIDPLRRLDLNRQVQDLRKQHNTTVIWVTHDVIEALQFATHIVAIAPPNGITNSLDLSCIPPIEDSARLSVEALSLRNHILEVIKGDSRQVMV